jgi:hypothetical protein
MLTRKVAALARVLPTFTLSCEENALVSLLVVYYKSIKQELKKRCIYECRCDERLQTKPEESTLPAYTGFLDVNRRDVCECDG